MGIDIERRNRPFQRIAYQFLTIGELAWIDLEDTLTLALIWSAKEAFFKVYNREGLNSFTNLDVLPFRVTGTKGFLPMLVHVSRFCLRVSLEYSILDNFVITWAVCNPQLFQWDDAKA